MSEVFHTVEKAAERLQLHPRTILRFIRQGRLRATRIGKAYRILQTDLDAFAGAPPPAPATEGSRVTAIIDMPGVGVELSQRLASALRATVVGAGVQGRPIKLDTIYDPERRHLKVVILAGALDAAALIQSTHNLAEALR